MASLAGRSLVSSYKELLKLNNASLNSGISGSLQGVEDGFAGATALQISNAAVASTGTLASTGDFSVATNKLTVAAASGNTAVAGTLSATGDLAINTNKFTVAASSGNTVVAGTLNVSGTSTLASVNGTSGSFSSTLASTGDFSVATNKFNVTAASGNTAVAGTLSSAGDFSVATNKLTVAAATGNTAVAGTLSATGNLAINTNKFNVTASNGNTSVAGTLTVSDYADFSSTGAIRVPRGLDGERPAGQAGMLRFNTASQVFEGHNGVLWGSIGSGGGGGGSSQYVREKFTATSGQTSFTITGGYTPERIDVFQNGIKLVNGDDVTVTSGTSIVLTTGAVAGDVIDVVGLASGNFAGPATAKRQNFTATAGQTIFTVTGGYTPGQLDVFQNGTKLLNAVDVDVSNGSTFTLTTGANLNDTIEVVGFTAADTISGTLKFQAGTAAAPSITTFGDTNTGIFFPAADTIAFSEGGTESMRIDSSGNVGIGVVTSISSLHIKNATPVSKITLEDSSTNRIGQIAGGSDGSGGYLAFSTGNNGGSISERLRIDSSGNVGIGGTPSTLLHLQSTSPSLRIQAASGNSGALDFYRTASVNSGQIASESTNALVFSTNTSTNSGLTERLRIDSSGRVGIGTTSPAYKFVVSEGGAQGFEFQTSSSTQVDLLSYNRATSLYTDCKISTNNLIVSTGTSSASERLRIDSSGNVGIGVTSPSAKLEIGMPNSSFGSSNPFFNSKYNNISHFKIFMDGDWGTHLSSIPQSGQLSHFAIDTNNTERLRITSGGVVRIGTTTELLSSANILEVSGTNGIGIKATGGAANPCMLAWNSAASGNNTFAIFYTETSPSSVGSIDFNRASTLTRYNTTSDATLKNIIGDSSGEESVSILKNTRIRDYTWKKDATNKVNVGVIAQELYEVFKGAVSEGGDIVSKDSDGNDITTYRPWGVDKTAFTFHLVAGWQAHEKLIQELKSENDSLKTRIAALEAA